MRRPVRTARGKETYSIQPNHLLKKTVEDQNPKDDQPSLLSERSIEDHAIFVRLFARDHHRIFSYIFSLLHNRADAEDVFQRTSLILWQKFGDFDQDRDFAAWSCGVAFYTVKNFLRVASRKRMTFDVELLKMIAEERVETFDDSDERTAALDKCIEELPAADRELINQAYFGDRPLAEVADELGRAVQTIYNRLNLIRQRLVLCVQSRLPNLGMEE